VAFVLLTLLSPEPDLENPAAYPRGAATSTANRVGLPLRKCAIGDRAYCARRSDSQVFR
jgi:hypothetical protein